MAFGSTEDGSPHAETQKNSSPKINVNIFFIVAIEFPDRMKPVDCEFQNNYTKNPYFSCNNFSGYLVLKTNISFLWRCHVCRRICRQISKVTLPGQI